MMPPVIVNDNVLYHSLFGLASGKGFLGPLVRKWAIPVEIAAYDFAVNTSHIAVSGQLPDCRPSAQNFAFRIQQPVSHSLYSSMVTWVFGYSGI